MRASGVGVHRGVPDRGQGPGTTGRNAAPEIRPPPRGVPILQRQGPLRCVALRALLPDPPPSPPRRPNGPQTGPSGLSLYIGRSASDYRVEIGAEVPRPRPGHAGGIGLPRTQRDADATVALAGRDRGDPEWAGIAGSWCPHALTNRRFRARFEATPREIRKQARLWPRSPSTVRRPTSSRPSRSWGDGRR